ncbi:putative Histidine kinase [Candidatus Desulfarcum epimagneticum]|uniref:histidine kinase n=1 Tax=uncultured Desulfobacteraceae bacterium TaxID=218296 RepID=A0A484HKU0_9BACT|nr:putative Histidine kinase [uncultured Desulfobacteraceae bacterium]
MTHEKKTGPDDDFSSSGELFAAIMNHTRQAMFWQDPNLAHSGCNREFAHASGIENPGDMIGKTLFELPFEKKDAEFFHASIQKALSRQRPVSFFEKKICLKGKERPLNIKFIPLNGPGKKESAGVLCVWQDMSEKNGEEKKTAEMKKKFLQSCRLAALGEMTAGIAHEMNQPLSIINAAAGGISEYFSTKEDGGVMKKSCDKILRQLDRVYSITETINSFARKNADAPGVSNLREPLGLALSFFRERFRMHEIAVEMDLERGIPPAGVDPQKFERIVINLLNNALFAMREKAKKAPAGYRKKISIALSWDPFGKRVVFEVRDNGVGMGEETLQRCMTPFYTTKKMEDGMGMGLAIVNDIASEFEIEVEMESVQGQWTACRVSIPAAVQKP